MDERLDVFQKMLGKQGKIQPIGCVRSSSLKLLLESASNADLELGTKQ